MRFDMSLDVAVQDGHTMSLDEYKQETTRFREGMEAVPYSEINETTILRITRDFAMLACQGILSVAGHVSISTRKILKPFYEFLRSAHNECNQALEDPSYTFKPVQEPDLPDFDDVTDEDRSVMKEIASTIVQSLPSVVDAISIAYANNIPHAKEVKIIVNTINSFCEKMSA